MDSWTVEPRSLRRSRANPTQLLPRANSGLEEDESGAFVVVDAVKWRFVQDQVSKYFFT